jgi:hypothetical protein
MEGLNSPPDFADRVGVEAEVGEAAAPRNLAQLPVIWGLDPGKLDVEFVERLLQCGALLRLDLAFANSRGRKACGRAQ